MTTTVSIVIFLALTIAIFALLGLVQKLVERL
ncbi:potassium-transporting ATPase [Mycolicibacterium bacteremicum]|nr:potassium-transporting ATPase [Mycolicibacterium bacteremicum]MCV7430832.1 potassium-transporting ATPase [Mycolicibacterium bacteremicum]